MDDLISRHAAIDVITNEGTRLERNGTVAMVEIKQWCIDLLQLLPSAQPQYEELTPEEAASEIASGSMMSARYWLDVMIRLNQMGYAICRKR